MADPQTQPRFSGIPTFFRTPYEQDLSAVDIGVIGVPFDGGVTNRPGTRHGPRELRNQSSLSRKINTATGVQPFDGLRVRDLGDCWIEQPYSLEPALAEIEAFYRRVVSAGVVPLSAGGDHSMTLPILRAVAASGPVGMVHIDAHADTGDEYMGSRYHHGTPFRRAVDEGLLDPRRVIQIGIRGHSNVSGGLWGVQRVQQHAGYADRGAGRQGLALGGRGGAARGGRRANLPVLRHRQPGPDLRAGHRHAGTRRHYHAWKPYAWCAA